MPDKTEATDNAAAVREKLEAIAKLERECDGEDAMYCGIHGQVPARHWMTTKQCGLCLEEGVKNDRGEVPSLVRTMSVVHLEDCPGNCHGTGRVAVVAGLRVECPEKAAYPQSHPKIKDCVHCHGNDWVMAVTGDMGAVREIARKAGFVFRLVGVTESGEWSVHGPRTTGIRLTRSVELEDYDGNDDLACVEALSQVAQVVADE